MGKTCLVIIFNHRYDKNISKLRRLYKERFGGLFFLVPFYSGDDADVIPIYESSFQFSGYLIQAYHRLMECDADYFLFTGDDCIINPRINEDNAESELKLFGNEAFVPRIWAELNSPGRFGWAHAREVSMPFRSRAVRWKSELPPFEEAMKRFALFYQREYEREYTDAFFAGKLEWESETEYFMSIAEFLRSNGDSRKILYPLSGGYCDIFAIKRERLFSIARINGIFSAMNLFVEVAFPTSVVLEIPREKVCTVNDLPDYFSKVVWSEKEKEELQSQFDSVNDLIKKWPEDALFMHPIKVSVLED